jgi:DNA-binding Xre family transcriptional regulator
MMSYDKLWETMKEKDISQYKLIKDYGISAGQLSRLRANVHISTHTIDMLCSILKCNVEDILTYYPDEASDTPDIDTQPSPSYSEIK